MSKEKKVVFHIGHDGNYDNNGNFIEYDKEGRVIRKTEYNGDCLDAIREYDENGHDWLTRRFKYPVIDPGPVDLWDSFYTQYFPDGEMKRLAYTRYDRGIMTSYIIEINDRSNKVVVDTDFKGNLSLDGITICPYAENPFKTITFDDKGKILDIQY